MVDTKDIKTIVLKYFKEENISSIKEIADKLIITINKDEDKQSKNKLLDELTLYFPSLKTTGTVWSRRYIIMKTFTEFREAHIHSRRSCRRDWNASVILIFTR